MTQTETLPPASAPEADEARTRVVLVDARPDRRAVMRQVFEHSGVDAVVVGEADGGDDAVALVKQHRAHLAVIELPVPVGDGLATIAALRQRFADLAVVVISFNTDAAVKDQARAEGADAYLVKPVSAREVVGGHPDHEDHHRPLRPCKGKAAWARGGTGAFDNDDAADWAYDLEEAPDLAPVRQALAATMDTDGWLEIPEGACAVAAATVVAASFDGIVKGLPVEVTEWVEDHPDAAGRSDARLAVDALERVTSEDSELRGLWEGAPEGPEWAHEIEALRHRLVRAIGDEVGAE